MSNKNNKDEKKDGKNFFCVLSYIVKKIITDSKNNKRSFSSLNRIKFRPTIFTKKLYKYRKIGPLDSHWVSFGRNPLSNSDDATKYDATSHSIVSKFK